MPRKLAANGSWFRCPLNGCKYTREDKYEVYNIHRAHMIASHPTITDTTWIKNNLILTPPAQSARLLDEYRDANRVALAAANAQIRQNRVVQRQAHGPRRRVNNGVVAVPATAATINAVLNNPPAVTNPQPPMNVVASIQAQSVTQPQAGAQQASYNSQPTTQATTAHQPPINHQIQLSTNDRLPYMGDLSLVNDTDMVDDNGAPDPAATNSASEAPQTFWRPVRRHTLKYRCYVCHQLVKTRFEATRHFYERHPRLCQPFLPERVARVWCDDDTGKMVLLAKYPLSASSLADISFELRQNILKHVMEASKHPDDMNKEAIDHVCFRMKDNSSIAIRSEAMEAFKMSNFFIRINFDFDVTSDTDLGLLQKFCCHNLLSVAPGIASEITPADFTITLSTHSALRNGYTSTTRTEKLFPYNEKLFAQFCLVLHANASSLLLSKADFAPSATHRRHRSTAEDVLRLLGYVRNIVKIKFHGLLQQDLGLIEQAMQQKLDTNLKKLQHLGDIIHDTKKLIRASQFSRALTSLWIADLIDELLPDTLYDGVAWANAAEELRWRYALLWVQAVNGLVEQETLIGRRLEMPLDRLRGEQMAEWISNSMGSAVVSDLERGQAHFEKGRICRFLASHAPPDDDVDVTTEVYMGHVADEAGTYDDGMDIDSSSETDSEPDTESHSDSQASSQADSDPDDLNLRLEMPLNYASDLSEEAANQFFFATRLLTGDEHDTLLWTKDQSCTPRTARDDTSSHSISWLCQ